MPALSGIYLQRTCSIAHDIHDFDIVQVGIDHPFALQRKVTHALRADCAGGLGDFMTKRLRWWLEGSSSGQSELDIESLAATAVNNVKVVAQSLPHHYAAAYLKALANAWITQWMIGGSVDHCIYGCGCEEGENIRHLMQCPALQDACAQYFLLTTLCGQSEASNLSS